MFSFIYLSKIIKGNLVVQNKENEKRENTIMARDGNPALAVLMLLIVAVTGVLIAGNWMHIGGFGLDLSLKAVTRFIDGFGIVLARLVGVGMAVISLYVIVNIIREEA